MCLSVEKEFLLPVSNDYIPGYILPNSDACAKTQPQVLLWIYSAVSNEGRRSAIRETWGQASLFLPIRVTLIFSLAVTNDQSLQKKIVAEQTKYGDLVQDGSFIDAYRNLTYKVI